MTLLVAIEGADGAGKNTAAQNVAAVMAGAGKRATVISFPRYGHTVGGKALGEFLSGRLTVPVAPSSLAVLYALDRFESREVIQSASASNDVVIFDRYIGSNVAYQGAKVGEVERPAFMRWIIGLETEVFGLPLPDLNVYLDTPFGVARKLMLLKQGRTYTERTYDEHEADIGLQERVRAAYERMVVERMLGPWVTLGTVDGDRLMDPDAVAAAIVRMIELAPGNWTGS